MRGRKPKSTVIKLLTGNPGKRRINKNEPQYSKMEVTPPPHLNAVARAEWARLCADMAAIGLLTVVDRAAFAAYCVSYSRWQKVEEKLNAIMAKSTDSPLGGMAFKTHNGNLSANVLIRIANTAMRNMIRTASEFGMTPASRSHAGVSPSGANYGDDHDPTEGCW